MAKIPHKIQERIKAALRRFKPLLKAARERDAGRADTATLALDLLSELFGYDRYSEITSELDNKESVFDFSIQTEGQPRMLVRVSPIGMAPDDRYLLATAQYAQMNEVDWIIMTNGIAWQVHHVEDVGANAPETPVVLAFDLLQMQPGREAHLGTIHLLTREGHEKAGLSHFKLRLEMTNRHYLGAMVLSDAVVASVRRELQKLNPDLRVFIIKTLAVDPAHRQAGLGSWLVGSAHGVAHDLGWTEGGIHALMWTGSHSRSISQHAGQIFRRYALFEKELTCRT